MKPDRICGVRPLRRDFLRSAAGAVAGFTAARNGYPQTAPARARNLLVLHLTGGPSQLETWDPKPDAPSHVRGPFRPIRTNVPGIEISELFPRMAKRADRFALVRSCYHTAEPVHQTGEEVVQTGRAAAEGLHFPHVCRVAAGMLGPDGADARAGRPAWADEPEASRSRYGNHPFGRACCQARQRIEAGTRFVALDMFNSVYGGPSWDAHGHSPFTSFASYRDEVAPTFDIAFSALLDDLDARGLLRETLVVTLAEFGRTPYLNVSGGRDHWQHCWTAILAGGGLRTGQVVGSSDARGAEPADRPVSPQQMLATIYYALGIPLGARLPEGTGNSVALLDSGTQPVHELF